MSERMYSTKSLNKNKFLFFAGYVKLRTIFGENDTSSLRVTMSPCTCLQLSRTSVKICFCIDCPETKEF